MNGRLTTDEEAPAARRARVLVVDDETTIRVLIARALEGEGYDVRTARDGYDALAAIETQMPDVLVLDLMMPGMPGQDVLQALRDQQIRLPTLVVSASLNSRLLAEAGGADLHMFKPFDLDTLCEHVQYLASLAEAERAPASDESAAASASDVEAAI